MWVFRTMYELYADACPDQRNTFMGRSAANSFKRHAIPQKTKYKGLDKHYHPQSHIIEI